MLRNEKGQMGALGVVISLVIVAVLIGAVLFGGPMYSVWSKGKKGQAELAQAEWSKKIQIEEAKAELEAAEMKAQTEVVRAHGIAEANRIIAGSITPEYIQYRFIEGLNDGNTEVIYVPTEANLPIMEAGRFAATAAKA